MYVGRVGQAASHACFLADRRSCAGVEGVERVDRVMVYDASYLMGHMMRGAPAAGVC
jgi:hypothetical protein